MTRKLQFKRGDKEDMPVLAQGEPAFTLDEERMYIGTGKKNIGLASTEDLNELKKEAGIVSNGFYQHDAWYETGSFLDAVNDLWSSGKMFNPENGMIVFGCTSDVTGLPEGNKGWYSILMMGFGSERLCLATPSWRTDLLYITTIKQTTDDNGATTGYYQPNGEGNWTNIYSSTNKPTASDVGAVVNFQNYGFHYSDYSGDVNVDNWTKSGIYQVASSCENLPTENSWGTLLVFSNESDTCLGTDWFSCQMYFDWNVSNSLWWRVGGRGTWGKWQQFDDGSVLTNSFNENLDCNEIPVMFSTVSGWDTTIQNAPDDIAGQWGLTNTFWSYHGQEGNLSASRTQTMVTDKGSLYGRRFENSQWGSWNERYLPADGSKPMTGDRLTLSTGGFFQSSRQSNHYNCFLSLPGKNNGESRLLMAKYDDDDSTKLFFQTHIGGTGGGSYEIWHGGNYPEPMQNHGFHNSVYRGKSLGTYVTDEQYTAISAGTFDDLFIGDYWTINNIVWRIAAFDYYLYTGDTSCTTHHVVIVPDSYLYTHCMNEENTIDGGYVGSQMYTEGLKQAKEIINNAFGADHVLKYRQLLTNATYNGYASGGSWYDSTVELMNEVNVYGCTFFSNVLQGTSWAYNYTIDKTQFPLFRHNPYMINPKRQWWWLRDVASATNFANVGGHGHSNADHASFVHGVRPAFSIC